MRATYMMLAGWIAIVAGCSEYKPAAPPSAAPPAPQAAAAKPATSAAPAAAGQPAQQQQSGSGMTAGMSAMGGAMGMAPLETAVGGPGAVAPVRSTTQPAAPAATPGGIVVGPAQVGSGAKGRGYGMGPIATPAAAYFAARERITFEIQVPHALQLYKASNGSAPKTHQEFEQKILRENKIQLPDLPPGMYYQYDPALEQLMVMKPAPPQ